MTRVTSIHPITAVFALAAAISAATGCSVDTEQRQQSDHALAQATPTVAPFTETPVHPGEVHDYLFPPKQLARVFTSGDADQTFTFVYDDKQLSGPIGSKIVLFNSTDQPKTYAARTRASLERARMASRARCPIIGLSATMR